MVSDDGVQVLFNPRCSKCRSAQAILQEKGVRVDQIRYLEQAPTRAEVERILSLLGTDDPREMMRTTDRLYEDLGLQVADAETLVNAMVEHPILIERPIILRGDRAVIGRPPERALELLDPNEGGETRPGSERD